MISKTIYKNPISVWLLGRVINFYTIPNISLKSFSFKFEDKR